MKIDYFLPQRIVSNTDLAKEFPDWDYQSFEKKVGIFQRHVAEEGVTALDLGVKAGEKVLEDFDKSKIDYIIFCTQSPDYFLPTSACLLQDYLGLNKNCGALDFNLGCSGYVYGLSLAKGLLSAGIASDILLVTAETYSKHIHPKDRTNRAIFGDAGAATIISSDDLNNLGEFCLYSDGSGYDKLIVKNGAFRNPLRNDAEEILYGTDNTYTENHLYMNGPDVFNFTIENIPRLVGDTLKKNELSMEDIDFVIFHQANTFMLNFLRKKIKVPKEKFYINLRETGNTVSCTLPVALKQAEEEGFIKRGDQILLAGFGVGLSWGATIITF